IMVLDVTGSMKGQKLLDLETAASDAVDLLLASNQNVKDRVRVGLVPYANAVNAGALSHTVYEAVDATSPVEAPRITLVSLPSGTTTCGTEREGREQFTDAGPETQRVNLDYRVGSCPSTPLMPLTSDAGALKSRIASFRADGYTAGQIGIQWGWYLMSPKWSGVLPASARPHSYGDRKFAKYAILMTDGEFNTAFADVADGQIVSEQADKARANAEKLCVEMR